MSLEKLSFLSLNFFFSILLLMLFVGCSEWKEVGVPSDYLIFRCHSFYVVEHNVENPEGRTLLQVGKDEGVIITSIAYFQKDKLLAVALTNNISEKGTAIIKLFNYPDISLQATLTTGKDRINSMDFNDNGDLLFLASDMNRNNTGELCYVEHGGNVPIVLAKDLFFGRPTWDTDSVGVFFSYSKEQKKKRSIAYLTIEEPKIFKDIGPGTSVSVSTKGDVAYFHNGKILFSKGGANKYRPLDLPDKNTDPRVTHHISFVKGSNDLILQRFKKLAVYDLLATLPPYTSANAILADVGMLDFEVIKR